MQTNKTRKIFTNYVVGFFSDEELTLLSNGKTIQRDEVEYYPIEINAELKGDFERFSVLVGQRKIENNIVDTIDYKSLANTLIDRMAEIDSRETRDYLREILTDEEVRSLGFGVEEKYEIKVVCEYYLTVMADDLDEAMEHAYNYTPESDELVNFEFFPRKV